MLARMIDVGEVRLHVMTTAPAADAPRRGPVVLLHGFPSFWRTWRHQIAPLAAAGHEVIVPDLRGYNLSEKPRGVDAYTIDRISGDVLGLVRALGHERALIVGHDWGGVAAWNLGMQHPEAVERLIVINAPHPRIASTQGGPCCGQVADGQQEAQPGELRHDVKCWTDGISPCSDVQARCRSM